METYSYLTENLHPDNEFTMDDYLSNHLPNHVEMIFQDRDYAEIRNINTNRIWGVTVSENSDAFNHKIEFEFIH